MLHQVADGVLVHESEFLQSNAVVVQGDAGVLLIDPGITRAELAGLADDIRELGRPVVAGFSTHPHWDHVLWHAAFGDAPRYSTARGAAILHVLLAQPDWQQQIAEGLPPEHADEIPMELLGLVTALPAGATQIPWHGPTIRIIEHQGHSPADAALLIEDRGVLVAGDMLSDILMPFLNRGSAKPLDDYLAALEKFDEIADAVSVVIPGHGSVGGPGRLRARIELDRAYVRATRDGGSFDDDPRLGPAAPLDWLPELHRAQLQRFSPSSGEPRRPGS